MSSSPGTRGADAASAVVWFVGISQGLVPLVVLVLAVVALLAIDHAKERAVPESGEAVPVADKGGGGYDALSGLVLLAGIYNGLAPFVARLVFGGGLFLAFTLRLPAPWWWLASLGVVVLTVVLLEWIDRAKQRAAGPA